MLDHSGARSRTRRGVIHGRTAATDDKLLACPTYALSWPLLIRWPWYRLVDTEGPEGIVEEAGPAFPIEDVADCFRILPRIEIDREGELAKFLASHAPRRLTVPYRAP
jgi:hypothetical protein